MAHIIELKGNIFSSKCQVITNTVNCEGVMGKGLAMEFKYRYPEMFNNYFNVCQNGLLKPGNLLLWKKSKPWILNFPTKFFWKLPSKIDYIEFGMKEFASIYRQESIASIAFPQLGVSNGGLQWDIVRRIMYKHLEPLSNLNVEIYNFDSKSKDNLFNDLYKKVLHMNLVSVQEKFKLGKKQSRILFEVIKNNKVESMVDIQKTQGLGEKSIEKIYLYLSGNIDGDSTKEIIQPKLF